MANLLQQFRSLLPQSPLLVGEVTAIAGGIATVELPDGSIVTARGDATVGWMVFVRAGAIEGQAPDLTVVEITL